MDSTPQHVSRRGLLVAAAAGSAIALTAPTVAQAAPTTGAARLVSRDRIGAALTRLPSGRLATSAYAVDFHDRLSEWLRFWWANAPSGWRAPFEVVGEVTAGGHTYLLSAIRHTAAGQLTAGFDADRQNPAYWATVASLHRFFPAVQAGAGPVRIDDGVASFTGSPAQLDLVRQAHLRVWHGTATAEVTGRGDWHTFTKATLRQGLGTDS